MHLRCALRRQSSSGLKPRVSQLLFTGAASPAHTDIMRPSNQRLLQSFRDYLRVEKGLAALTVSSYESDLLQFSEFLHGRRRELQQARREDVRGFLSQLFGNGLS